MPALTDPKPSSSIAGRTRTGAPQAGPLDRSDPTPATTWWRGAVIGAAALALGLGALGLVWLLARPLALLFAAVVLAEALSPLVERLERWLPRSVAVAAVYLALLGALAGVGWLVVPPLVDQGAELVERAPDLVADGRALVDRWDPGGADRIVATLQSRLDRFGGSLVSLPLAIVSSVFEIVLVFFMSAYWLISAPALRRFVLSLFPEPRRGQAGDVLAEVGQTLGGYVRGEGLTAAVIGVVVYVGLLVIGVDFPLVLALIAAVGELIPVAGPFIAAIPALGVALLASPTQALLVLVFYVAVQQFESNVLLPNVMRRQADIPPLLAVFAFFSGEALGGILGAIIAIPVAGAGRVLVLRVVTPAIRRWAGATRDGAVGEEPS